MIKALSKPLQFLYTNKAVKNKNGSVSNRSFMRWWAVMSITMFISVGTWNPSGVDFVHYFMEKDFAHFFTYLEALVVLLIWMLSFTALYKAVGKWGIGALILMTGLFFGGIVQNGWLDIWAGGQVGWFANVSLGIILWFGIMAPRLWKTITGQYVVTQAEGSSISTSPESNGGAE